MDTSNWKWFHYNEIFDIKKGKRLTKEDMVKGDIRYIGAIDSNNGVSAFIGNDSQLHKPNTISLSYNGSIGYAYYQNKEFWATDDVNVLYPKFEMNKYIALYLCTLIEKEQYRFCYGRKWDLEMMNESTIKLPITSSGKPNWQYIEDFVKNTIVPKLPKRAKEVWIKQYSLKPVNDTTLKLTDREWRYFSIDSFCHKPYKAIAYNAIELITCNRNNSNSIAYVTRTETNNGCKDFVINEDFDNIEEGNAITIGDTTATINYQDDEFICGDHMVILRSPHFNHYIGLFITALLNKERFRYNYGRAFNKGIIENTKLKLPVTKDNKPDWKFMEDYIKSLPYSRNI